jgi:hypothetical protein
MNPLKIVIIAFVFVLVYLFIRYLTTNPYTLTDIKDAQKMTMFTKDDLESNDAGVPSSNFSYSVWFYINDWNYRYSKPKIIFGRMGATGQADGTEDVAGIAGSGPCPVVSLDPMKNDISVSLGCYPGINEATNIPGGASSNTIIHKCSVSNVPIQKWVNFTMSVYNRTLDVYLNGKLVRTCMLPGVANVNNKSNVYLTPAGGFSGWTSKLQYFADALSPQKAWDIYTKGYNTWIGNLFGSYSLEVSLVENGQTQSSVTI